MRKILLLLIAYMPLLSIGQGIGMRVNGLNGALEQYVQNSPGNTLGNSRMVTSLKDSSWYLMNNDSFLVWAVRNTLNHGTPGNMLWSLNDGTLRTSPVTSIPITSGQVTSGLGFTPVTNARSLTINGTSLDLSANRSWSVGDVLTTSSYSNPAWITGLAWSKISSTPTTISGYGITDVTSTARAALSAGTGISYNSSTGVIINSSPNQSVSLTGDGVGGSYPSFTITEAARINFTGYGTGTAYTMTTTSQKVTFGTTSPTVTLTSAGTYKIECNLTLNYNGLTTLSLTAANFKLRRTNNTAVDLTNASQTFSIPVLTLASQTGGNTYVPTIIYTTSNSNDVIELWANLGASVSVGSVTIPNAYVIATRMF